LIRSLEQTRMTPRAVHQSDASTPPAEDALAWAIALQENPEDVALRARFEAWCAENADAWAEASKVWALVGQAATHDVGPPKQPSRFCARLAIGAGLAAIAAAILVFLLPLVLIRVQADHLTGTAEIRTFTLEDGSRVTLGADSAIAVDYGAGQRRIDLLRGEAFFEVAHDPTRPFRVATGELESVALGTQFDVHRSKEGITVAVAEGSVGIATAGIVGGGMVPSDPLQAGDWARFDWSGHRIAHGQSDPAAAGAWRVGRLVVGDWPLNEVVDQLRRYYGGIILSDDALAGLRVTGTYWLADPVAALRAATYPHGVTVRQVVPWVIVLSRD
jgi:transmembrane sensor